MGKKTTVFLLLLVTLLLMVSCSEGDFSVNTSDVLLTTSEPEISGVPVNITSLTSCSEGTVSIPSASYVSGTLLVINDKKSFQYHTDSLLTLDELGSYASYYEEHNLIRLYGRKSQNYSLTSSRIFMKEDAFQPWEDMMAAFVLDTGKKSVQIVSSYVYSGEDSCFSSFVTGYSVAINLFEDGANYSLASSEKMVTVSGKTMTCLEWFQDHCAQYGFVYMGLDGTQAKTVATFRYVGVPHALAMQKLDFVDTEEYVVFIRNCDQNYTVIDTVNDITWNIDYYSADRNQEQTQITLPKGAVYMLSGNNIDGFIVAYYMPKS